MVIANPPLAEPVIDPGGVTIKPPFEMGVANFERWELPGIQRQRLFRQEHGQAGVSKAAGRDPQR